MDKINSLFTRLVHILGKHKVMRDLDILEKYARDETSDIVCLPDMLVRCDTAQDVSVTLALCNEHGVPVTPRGAGSGVTAGCVPVEGGVVLSLEAMNRILDIDVMNMIAVVEPGVITADLQKAVAARGLMYPPDPASLEMCSIGGNVAENAGGPRAVKYGTTKDYILGLEFVLPDGTIMRSGGKMVKNASGYNMVGLLTGSEGTLAVITKIYLRLIPAPPVTRDLLMPFESMEQAIAAVCAILAGRSMPAALEFMEENALRLVARHLGSTLHFPEARAHLLVLLDGTSEDAVLQDMQAICGIIGFDPDRMLIAVTPSQRERLWHARRSIREALKAASPVFLAEDCVVPRSEIPAFLKAVQQHAAAFGVEPIMFGHAGDGNVHIDILKGDMPLEHWRGLLPEIRRAIYHEALQRGGTITGEHGIGRIRRNYLQMAVDMPQIELMMRIKKAFDPRDILNPGKIFPER